MGSKAQAKASSAWAAAAKKNGHPIRTQGRCGICDRMAGIPMDHHINVCTGPRRKGGR